MSQIAGVLTEEKRPTKRAGLWHSGTVSKVLARAQATAEQTPVQVHEESVPTPEVQTPAESEPMQLRVKSVQVFIETNSENHEEANHVSCAEEGQIGFNF